VSRPRVYHLALLLPLAATAVWVAGRARVVRDDPAAVLAVLRAAHGPQLPEAAQTRAKVRTEAEAYDRDTLYEFIDGAADAYLARGFERCVAASYTFATDGGALELAAEAHRFSSPDGARLQLEAEKPADAAAVAGAAGTWADATTLLAVRGRDLLKLTSLTPNANATPAMLRVAAAWAKERSP
jgi:hypothetical protein